MGTARHPQQGAVSRLWRLGGECAENSQKQEAAWDYIMWYASPENSARDVVTSGSGINPYRLSHFFDIDA
ncbi:hypothetical protein [Candidatus Reidiella endopervernicosa]|uniref:Uncharacterized protein n=1 Tax=Candidatus Reidiella endopervernicosa TaxID=2738883 RepID=A0A6N0HZI4_9GAMM|nr:hypothetical protein [Candidatus Reidiella endopervernicosa]QKQ27764.1 hypothetical protein HUE57_16840 [Candidatus Reidiella endopervernicosa]